MNPEASFALRCSVAKMRAAGRVDEKALEGVRMLLESWRHQSAIGRFLQMTHMAKHSQSLSRAHRHNTRYSRWVEGTAVDGGTPAQWNLPNGLARAGGAKEAERCSLPTWLASCRRRILRQLMMATKGSGEGRVWWKWFGVEQLRSSLLAMRLAGAI